MAILSIAQQGAAILHIKAEDVSKHELGSEWLRNTIAAMQETMLQRNGVGIAAPQVYISKRIIIVASRPNPRYPNAPEMQAIAMINPEILEQSEQQLLGEEGCLSVPEQRGQVMRAEQIKVAYYTVDGQEKIQHFTGFPARIVQHEIDHLNGILFVERLT